VSPTVSWALMLGRTALPRPAAQRRRRGRKPFSPGDLGLKLQALEVFCEVARLRSFSRGGAAFDISQSAASQIVANLEDELGVILINRRRRPLELTPEGQIYYHGCQDLLHRYRALVEEIRRHRNALQGTVRVASIYSAGLH